MDADLASALQSMLIPRSPQAARIDALWWLFLVVSTLVFLAVVGALWLALFRSGRREVLEHRDGEPEKARVVVVAVGATVVVLLGLLTSSVVVGRQTSGMPDDSRQPLTIDVIGHQWWWEVRYHDPLPANRFTTANELRIPTGRPVIVRLTSRDVIHSFWVPSLHGKMDMVPGKVNTIWFEADAPGVYRGQCAEFCGLQHAKMAFVVVAEPPDAYEAWAARQREPATPPADALTRQGEAVFLSSQCALCHAIRGTGAFGLVAPDLTHIGGRLTLGAATIPNTRGHMGGWIVDPQRIKPGTFMPPTSLEPADLQALLAYLDGLR